MSTLRCTRNVILVLLVSIVYSTVLQARTELKSQVFLIEAVELLGADGIQQHTRDLIASKIKGHVRASDLRSKVTRTITDLLAQDGFLDATATVGINTREPANETVRVQLTVELIPGQQYKIVKIWWSGSSRFTPAELDQFSLLRIGYVFRRGLLDSTAKILSDIYATRGYGPISVTPIFQTFPKTGSVVVYMDVLENLEGSHASIADNTDCQTEDLKATTAIPYPPSVTYDPKRNAESDLSAAVLQAKATGKKVMVFVGGLWCGWCRALDRTIKENATLSTILQNDYVKVYVNVSSENDNHCALSRFPKAPGFPFLYVLDSSGNLLASQNPVDWESMAGYDAQKIESFLVLENVNIR